MEQRVLIGSCCQTADTARPPSPPHFGLPYSVTMTTCGTCLSEIRRVSSPESKYVCCSLSRMSHDVFHTHAAGSVCPRTATGSGT